MGIQKRLHRKGALLGFQLPVHAEQRLARRSREFRAGTARDGPIRLLAQKVAGIVPARRFPGDPLKQPVGRGAEIQRRHFEVSDPIPLAGSWRTFHQPETEIAGLHFTQRQVIALAIAVFHSMDQRPGLAIIGAFDPIVRGVVPRIPIDDEAAIFPGALEVEYQPLGLAAGGTMPARAGRRLDDALGLAFRQGARRGDLRRPGVGLVKRKRLQGEFIDP